MWENEMYNADFDTAAYEEIMLEAGLNRFIMSVRQWVSPQFKLYLIKEFERLKKDEQALLGWSAKQWRDKNPDKNSIFPDSTLIHIRTPKRPDVDHRLCVVAGNMRNSL